MIPIESGFCLMFVEIPSIASMIPHYYTLTSDDVKHLDSKACILELGRGLSFLWEVLVFCPQDFCK